MATKGKKKVTEPKVLTDVEKAQAAALEAAAAAKKQATEAAKVAEKAQKDAEKARAKTKLEADAKAKHTEVLRNLTTVAREINVRIEKADKLSGDANDHRLAAALQLAAAKEKCEKAKLSFKEWAEANIVGKSYETIRKLATAGAAEDPKLAIEDMRLTNKEANKKSRAKKKTAGGAPTLPRGGAALDPKKTAEAIAISALKAVKADARKNLITTEAESLKLAVLPQAEVTRLQKIANAPVKTIATAGYDGVVSAFCGLKPSEKMKFLDWASKEVGGVFSTEVTKAELAEKDEASLTDIPAAMKR
jgi:hypothetical protein